jgi:hypothetical protein
MKWLSLIILLLIFFVSACGTSSHEEVKSQKEIDKKTSDTNEEVYEETKEGLQFSILLNKNQFTTDDEIVIKTKVTNVSDKTITYHAGSSGGPRCEIKYPLIRIPNHEHDKNFVIKPSYVPEPGACPADVLERNFEPNDSFEREMVYLPKILLGDDEIEVTSGEYMVEVSFAGVSISYPITITSNTKGIIVSSEAEEIAKKHPEVQQWITEHTGESVSKTENEEYHILWYFGWTKTSKEEYEALKEGIYEEEKGISYKDGHWSIVYISKIGRAPHRIEIKVDALEGEVVSIQTYER